MSFTDEDTVMVMRVLIYKGKRSWVESTLKNSGVKDGTTYYCPKQGSITAMRIGEFPEVIKTDA